MSVRLGVAIASDRVRAVAVRGRQVLWAGEAERGHESSLASDLARLIREAPHSRGRVRGRAGSPLRWRRPIAVVAVGPAAAQMKRLAGLPLLDDARALALVVGEGASRFFLRNGVPLVTTGVRPTSPGEAWAAAIEAPVVDAAERACRDAGVRLALIVPAVVALGAAARSGTAPDERIEWEDGTVRVEIVLERGAVASVRRLAGGLASGLPRPRSLGASAVPMTTQPEARAGEAPVLGGLSVLAALGEAAHRFHDAYGAALVSLDEPVAVRARDTGRIPRRRLVAAIIAVVLAVVAALASPGVAATWQAKRDEARLRSLAPRRRVAVLAETELGRMTGALGEVSTFEARWRGSTHILAALARVLPDGSAIVALRITSGSDSAGGTLVVLAPRAAAVVDKLERSGVVVAPEVIGPITRESAGGREVERVSIRFRLPRATRARRVAP